MENCYTALSLSQLSLLTTSTFTTRFIFNLIRVNLIRVQFSQVTNMASIEDEFLLDLDLKSIIIMTMYIVILLNVYSL